jgi:hypothetical protein
MEFFCAVLRYEFLGYKWALQDMHSQTQPLHYALWIRFTHSEELRMQELPFSYSSGLVYARIYLFRPCLYINDITQPTENSVR